MGNGKWKMENENGNRGTGNGKRKTGNGKRERKTGNGKRERKTGNEERGTGNAYLKSKASALSDRNFSTRKNLYNNNNNNNNNNNGLVAVHPWYGSSPDVK